MKNIICLITCLCGITAYAGKWELTVLGSATNESGAYGVNSYGFAVGYEMRNGSAVPCIWDASSDLSVLPSLPVSYYGSVGCAYAINDNFVIAGTYDYWNASDEFHLAQGYAAYWYFDTAQTNFVSSDTGVNGFTAARGINNENTIAGWSYMEGGGGIYEFFVNDVDTGHNENGWSQSRCFGINDSSNACGDYADSMIFGSSTSPCFFQMQANGFHGYTVNTSLPGSCGMAINNKNEIVGYGNDQGFYWNPGTGSTVSFGNGTSCYGINDRSIIVGTTNGRACMWTNSSNGFVVCDLNGLISNTNIVLEHAFGINTNNQIVGQLLNKSTGIRSGFMLSPITGVKARLTKTSNGATLSWDSQPGHSYSFKYSRDMVNWNDVPGIYLAEDQSAYVTTLTDEPVMFFEVFDHTP